MSISLLVAGEQLVETTSALKQKVVTNGNYMDSLKLPHLIITKLRHLFSVTFEKKFGVINVGNFIRVTVKQNEMYSVILN